MTRPHKTLAHSLGNRGGGEMAQAPPPVAHSFHEHVTEKIRLAPMPFPMPGMPPPSTRRQPYWPPHPLPPPHAKVFFCPPFLGGNPPLNKGKGIYPLAPAQMLPGRAGSFSVEGQKGHKAGNTGHPGIRAWLGGIPSLPT